MSRLPVSGSPVTRDLRRGHSGPLAEFFTRLVREQKPGAAFGVVVVLLLLIGIIADWLAPYGMNEINLMDRLEGPSGEHWLGTDQLGRDVFSRIIYGARISVIVGLSATIIAVVISAVMGITTGFFVGKLDLVVQRFVDAFMSLPGILILITVMSLLGQGVIQIIVVLGVLNGIRGSRIIRGAVIAIKENDYFTAAHALGSSNDAIMIRHVLPNVMAPIIIIFSTEIGGIILTEASLSFLGFGLPPDVPSWGGMLSSEGRRFMEAAPHLALWPGVALSAVVYATNMFGDAMRDLLDPRLRGGVEGRN